MLPKKRYQRKKSYRKKFVSILSYSMSNLKLIALNKILSELQEDKLITVDDPPGVNTVVWDFENAKVSDFSL